MSKSRETIISNCEKKFMIKCLSEYTRLDARAFIEFRPLTIEFGKDWGCCYVSLGSTSVLAQTSCEIQQPKSSRPSEGILNINIELNPMGAPHFEPGRQSELAVQLNRILEKCIKDSKAVDLESLCIKTNEKVWALRVDLNVLNHDGNILDCAGIAMLASLAHFKRPDVTCDGEDFIIHTYQQRDPIPIVIHHYPVSITFAIFDGGEYIVADPRLYEEGGADALLIISLNGFKELCGLHLGGKAELTPSFILNAVSQASSRVADVIEEIKKAIRIDADMREKKEPIGFHSMVDNKDNTEIDLEVHLNEFKPKGKKKNRKKKKAASEKSSPKVEIVGQGSAAYEPKAINVDEDSSREDNDDDLIIIENKTECIHVSDTEEEDDVIILDDGKYNTIEN